MVISCEIKQKRDTLTCVKLYVARAAELKVVYLGEGNNVKEYSEYRLRDFTISIECRLLPVVLVFRSVSSLLCCVLHLRRKQKRNRINICCSINVVH